MGEWFNLPNDGTGIDGIGVRCGRGCHFALYRNVPLFDSDFSSTPMHLLVRVKLMAENRRCFTTVRKRKFSQIPSTKTSTRRSN